MEGASGACGNSVPQDCTL